MLGSLSAKSILIQSWISGRPGYYAVIHNPYICS